MAAIRPFRCIHPANGREEQAAALPYDVYSREEARRAVEGRPDSFLNIDRPETQFAPEQDMYASEVYEKAAELLKKWRADGRYVQEKKPVYYLYELTMNGRSQTGIVACASVDDYRNGVIKKHENTRAEKEEDRIRHIDTCNTQTGPIFLAYRENRALRDLTEKIKLGSPEFSFVSEDGIGHAGWIVADEETITQIGHLFTQMDSLYIADGHHRAASAVKVALMRRAAYPEYDGSEEFNSFLSVLFPDEDLMIMDYNRAVKDLHGWSEEAFLKKVEEKFVVELLPGSERPKQKGQLSMCLRGTWYRLTEREPFQKKDPVAGLDVSYLQRELLEPVLGIQDPRTDDRIVFIGGIRGLEELERRACSDCAVAFAMHPTSMKELFEVADAGLLMPPKSTWFEPKLRSGLFLHEIEQG